MLANRKVPTFKFKKIIKKRSLRLNEKIRKHFLKTAKTALKELESFNLKDWDPIKHQELHSLFKNGESMHRLRRYFEANELFKEIIHQSNNINSLVPKVLETKIQNGYLLLEKDRPLEAIKSFSYALKYSPRMREQ